MYFQSFSIWLFGFKVFDTHHQHFFWTSNWSNSRSQFWSNPMTLVKLLFLRITLLLRSSKCIFKASLNKFYNIEPMTHFICIFCQYQVEQLQISVLKWSCRFSETIDIFRAFGTQYLHFQWISNWSNCRSLFWSDHMTLVKLLFFQKTFSRLFSKYLFKVLLNSL